MIIEGYKPFPIDGYSHSSEDGTITITNVGDSKGVFNANWSVIKRENGTGFNDSQELMDYLDLVFNNQENDFLAYYILNRDT